MNVQVTYWPFATANRLDTSAALLHLISAPEKREHLRANAPIAYQYELARGGAVILHIGCNRSPKGLRSNLAAIAVRFRRDGGAPPRALQARLAGRA